MSKEPTSIITSRHCKRKFTNKSIPKKIISTILTNAGHAGSSKNSQPWQVAVLTGKTKQTIVDTMCKKFDHNIFEEPDYNYMTNPMPDTYKERARNCGYALYKLKGIKKDDKNKRNAHFRENYTFFDAPTALIFHLHEGAERGNFLDMGLFIQNVMLGLVEHGLGSCPQFSICSYSQTIKNLLNIPKNRIIVCGMSVGYPDQEAIVNTFIPERLPLDEYVEWFE